jgi:hypothetical protein
MARDEATQGHKASHDSLNSLDVFYWTHVCDYRHLFWVGFDGAFRYDEPQKHASWDTEDTLLGVESDTFGPHASEGCFEIRDGVTGFCCLHYVVVDVGLDHRANVIVEDMVHATLICGACIPQPEGHGSITIHTMWGDERGHELVGLFHSDLMIIEVGIKEG